MALKESKGNKCPWPYRGQESNKHTVNFAMCMDCPMMEKLVFYPDHTVKVYCEKEGSFIKKVWRRVLSWLK